MSFESFVKISGPRLRAALVAAYGPDVGADAAAAALSYGWEHWRRLSTMSNPAGYLYRVGQSAARRSTPRQGYLPAPPPEELPNFEPGLLPALAPADMAFSGSRVVFSGPFRARLALALTDAANRDRWDDEHLEAVAADFLLRWRPSRFAQSRTMSCDNLPGIRRVWKTCNETTRERLSRTESLPLGRLPIRCGQRRRYRAIGPRVPPASPCSSSEVTACSIRQDPPLTDEWAAILDPGVPVLLE